MASDPVVMPGHQKPCRKQISVIREAYSPKMQEDPSQNWKNPSTRQSKQKNLCFLLETRKMQFQNIAISYENGSCAILGGIVSWKKFELYTVCLRAEVCERMKFPCENFVF